MDDEVPPPIPEKRRNLLGNGVDLLCNSLSGAAINTLSSAQRVCEPEYIRSCRAEVDYVPVDAALSRIYGQDSTASNFGDKYASVPKTERQDDTTLHASENTDWHWPSESCTASSHNWMSIDDQPSNHDYTTFAACSNPDSVFTENGGSYGPDGAWCRNSTAVDAAHDSDDGEYLPPLPTRNYGNALSRSCMDPAFTPLAQSDINPLSSSLAALDNEQTHMSWDEVMKEAQVLGIPLAAPKSEAADWRSSTSIASSDNMSDCGVPENFRPHDRMSCSEHGAIHGDHELSACRNNIDYLPEVFRHGSPSKMPSSPKSMSPFKDKFRLQNLFSKKGKGKKGDAATTSDGPRPVQRHVSAAAEIQRRNLPPLPPKRGMSETGGYPTGGGTGMQRCSLDHIPGSGSGSPARQRAHRTMSTLTLPSRDSNSMLISGSAWAGSSASVGGVSAGAVSTGSVVSIDSTSRGTDPAALGEFQFPSKNEI